MEKLPEDAVAARLPVHRGEGIDDLTFLRFAAERQIERLEVDVSEGRIDRQTATQFAAQVREELRRLGA